MNRREFHILSAAAGSSLLGMHGSALALTLNELSSGEASGGLKAALDKGADAAVSLLGRQDGFLGNAKVRIELPGFLKDAAKVAKTLGQGQRVDELVTAMNRAAEQAVPLARELLADAVRSIGIDDAKRILTGGETSVTRFFADKTRVPLAAKFMPIVTRAMENVGAVQMVNEFTGKFSALGFGKKSKGNLQEYVTGKALDGLYFMIGEEEKKIRRDPIGTGSALLGRVFGSMR